MLEFKQYVDQCEFSWGEDRRKSHIQTKIISSAKGIFGSDNYYSNIDPRVSQSTGRTFISLLSSIFWMFDLDVVISNNLMVETLKKGNTFADAKILLRQFMTDRELRSHESIPL
jgi:hypothetical protein